MSERHRTSWVSPRAVRRRQQLAQPPPIDSARYADQADVARHHGLTRARLTQLMNLLLLAPRSSLEYPTGREPITERLLESLVWEDQRVLWAELRAVAG